MFELLGSHEAWNQPPAIEGKLLENGLQVDLHDFGTEGNIVTTGIEWRWNGRWDDEALDRHLDHLTKSKDMSDLQVELIETASPYLEMKRFLKNPDLPPALQAMGFSVAVGESFTRDTDRLRRAVVTQPNTERINRFIDGAFPGKPNMYVNDRELPGSYSSEEGISALVEDGCILISPDILYRLHEHVALHPYGMIGGGKFLFEYRHLFAPTLIRAREENTLTEVPYTSTTPRKAIFEPAHVLLDNLMFNLDRFTTDIGENSIVGLGLPNSFMSNRIRENIENLFKVNRRGFPLGEIPHDDLDVDAVAEEIADRFRHADTYAEEFLRKAA